MINEKLLAAYKGAMQGATMGLADEATGMIGSAYARIMAPELFKNDGYFETYKQVRDIDRNENKKLQSDNPWTYNLSNIASGVAVPIGLAGKGLAGMMKSGGIAGGVSGYGYSEKEDPYSIAKDIGIGTGLGLGAGAVTYGFGKLAQNPNVQRVVKNYIKDESGSFKIPDFIKNKSDDIAPKIYSYKSSSGKTKFDIPYYSGEDIDALYPELSKKIKKEVPEGINLMGLKTDRLPNLYEKKAVEHAINKIKISNEKRFIKETLNKYQDKISNIHKNKNINFENIDLSDLSKITKIKTYKSPTYNGRQSSEYYLGILPDGEAAFIRKSNHWGTFYTNIKDPIDAAKQMGVSVDEAKAMADNYGRIVSKKHDWGLIGGKKSGEKYQNISQAGYIKLKDILND